MARHPFILCTVRRLVSGYPFAGEVFSMPLGRARQIAARVAQSQHTLSARPCQGTLSDARSKTVVGKRTNQYFMEDTTRGGGCMIFRPYGPRRGRGIFSRSGVVPIHQQGGGCAALPRNNNQVHESMLYVNTSSKIPPTREVSFAMQSRLIPHVARPSDLYARIP